MATIPLWTAVLARLFLGETLKQFAWLGLLVSIGSLYTDPVSAIVGAAERDPAVIALQPRPRRVAGPGYCRLVRHTPKSSARRNTPPRPTPHTRAPV